MEVDVDEFLEHFGVKGMHWGVRKDRSTGAEGTSTPDHSKRNKALKIAGTVAAVAVVAAGTAYLVKHPELLSKTANSLGNEKNVDKGKKLVDDLIKPKNELTGVAHFTGVSYLPDRSHRKGGLTNPLSELVKAGFYDSNGSKLLHPGEYRRYGDNLEKVAVSFTDHKGRTDSIGRPIIHDILLPKHHAEGITNFEDAKSKAWSLVKDSYEKFWDYGLSKEANNAEARSLGLMD